MAYAALTQPTIQPAVRIITAITQSNPAVVTTSFAHSYLPGLIVRLRVPPSFGMLINGRSGTILSVTTDTFTIDIDTSNKDAFVIPPNQVTPLIDTQTQFAQVVPMGEVTDTPKQPFRNVLPY